MYAFIIIFHLYLYEQFRFRLTAFRDAENSRTMNLHIFFTYETRVNTSKILIEDRCTASLACDILKTTILPRAMLICSRQQCCSGTSNTIKQQNTEISDMKFSVGAAFNQMRYMKWGAVRLLSSTGYILTYKEWIVFHAKEYSTVLFGHFSDNFIDQSMKIAEHSIILDASWSVDSSNIDMVSTDSNNIDVSKGLE